MKIQIVEPSDLGKRLIAIDISIEAIRAAWGTIPSSMSPAERQALETLKMMKVELLLLERNAAKEQREDRANKRCTCDADSANRAIGNHFGDCALR